MSKISEDKITKLKEEILSFLYENHPKMFYTYEIANHLIRDDEFVFNMLNNLKNNNLIIQLNLTKGNKIKRKWGITKEIHAKYSELLKQ